jgi:hypothetical protein
MLTENEQKLKDAEAKLREYASLEAKILILLHTNGDQVIEALYSKLCKDEPEARKEFHLALGNLLENGLIRPSTCVTPGITIIDELCLITGGFDPNTSIRNLELPNLSTERGEYDS